MAVDHDPSDHFPIVEPTSSREDTMPPESRLRGSLIRRSIGMTAAHGGLVDGPEVTTTEPREFSRIDAAGDQPPEPSPRLRGRGLIVARNRGPSTRLEEGPSIVSRYLDELRTTSLFDAAQKHGYAKAFGGELNFESTYNMHPEVAHVHPYDTTLHERIPFTNGFSKAIETGVDIAELVKDNPLGRYKFYSSLDLSTPEKQASAQSYMTEVHKLAAEQGIAMLTKTEDHNYDSCNIYTWQPEQMAEILERLHDKYPDIWQSVEHPLQGRVGDIDPKHVGYVQEPIGGVNNGSHSSRMGRLGRLIDENGGTIDAATWEKACAAVGVRADKPWLISDEAAVAYNTEQERRNRLSVK